MARKKNGEFNQIKYQNEYKKEKYDRIEIVAPKGRKSEIKILAKEAGQSVSEYIIQAINERIERESNESI